MKQLTKTILFKQISKAEIEKFELNNDVILPDYLKDFFLKYNGSRIREHIYMEEQNMGLILFR